MTLHSCAHTLVCVCVTEVWYNFFTTITTFRFCILILSDWLHTSGTDKNRNAGEFYWRNGEKVNRSLFKKGDPNDFKEGQETCVFVKESKLWDYNCAFKTYAICEAPTDCSF